MNDTLSTEYGEFLDLIYSDIDWLRTEFDAIVSTTWPDRRNTIGDWGSTERRPPGPSTSLEQSGPGLPININPWGHLRGPPGSQTEGRWWLSR
jgi:hypothetical protein